MARAKCMYVEVLPRAVPAGTYLVHNHLQPQKPLGRNGFRAWLAIKADDLVACRCNFGGCKNSKLHEVHYRVARISPPDGARLMR